MNAAAHNPNRQRLPGIVSLLLFVAQSLRRERTGVLRPRRYSATEVAAWLAEDQAAGEGRLTSTAA